MQRELQESLNFHFYIVNLKLEKKLKALFTTFNHIGGRNSSPTLVSSSQFCEKKDKLESIRYLWLLLKINLQIDVVYDAFTWKARFDIKELMARKLEMLDHILTTI